MPIIDYNDPSSWPVGAEYARPNAAQVRVQGDDYDADCIAAFHARGGRVTQCPAGTAACALRCDTGRRMKLGASAPTTQRLPGRTPVVDGYAAHTGRALPDAWTQTPGGDR